MLSRFEGENGRRLRIEAVAGQRIVAGNAELAGELADRTELKAVRRGEVLIEQDAARVGGEVLIEQDAARVGGRGFFGY